MNVPKFMKQRVLNNSILTVESGDLLLMLKYDNLNVKVESVSKILHVLFTLSAFGVILSSLLTTFVNYFIFNLGDESYYLFCPLWFV